MIKLASTFAKNSLAFLLAGTLLLLAGCAATPDQKEPEIVAFPPPPEVPRYFFERTILGSHNVEGASSEDRLMSMLTGTAVRRGQPFAKPFDVAVHQGRVFVSDTVKGAVFALDFPGKTSFMIGEEGDGELGKPFGVAVDQTGRLFVVDSRHKQVNVYDRDGNFLFNFGSEEIFTRPSGIDVTRDGSRAYVVDTGGVQSRNHVIHVFDARTGEHLSEIASRGSGEGELNLPRDIKVGPDGLLYVSDGGNFRVQVFTPEGAYVRQWGQVGLRTGQFSRPKGLSIDPEGNVYVVDAAFGNFQIFNAEGQLLMFIGTRTEKPSPGAYLLPAGIDVDEDGRIYVIDQFYRKLDIYRPAGLEATQGYLVQKVSEEKKKN